jgi:hypothetical protein
MLPGKKRQRTASAVKTGIHHNHAGLLPLASDLMSPTTQINLVVEVSKVVWDFMSCIASAFRLSTGKVMLPDLNSDLPRLDHQLKHKQRLRKLWHETHSPACKTQLTGSQKLSKEWLGERRFNVGK